MPFWQLFLLIKWERWMRWGCQWDWDTWEGACIWGPEVLLVVAAFLTCLILCGRVVARPVVWLLFVGVWILGYALAVGARLLWFALLGIVHAWEVVVLRLEALEAGVFSAVWWRVPVNRPGRLAARHRPRRQGEGREHF